MSTILKALRRLEQERAHAKGAERPLREEVVIARARRRGAWGAWLSAAAALAIGFGATWAALTRFGEGAPAPGADPRAPAPVAAGPPAPVAAAPPASLAAAPRADAPPAAPPAASHTVTVVPGAAAALPRAPVADAAGAPARRAPSPLDEPPAPARPTPDPVAVAAPPRVPASEDAPRAPLDAPLLTKPITGRASRVVDEPAPSARAELPVSVVRTSWHPRPDRRTAWVAIGSETPREVREGEWVGAYEVRAIEPDGVLFADGPLLLHEPVGAR